MWCLQLRLDLILLTFDCLSVRLHNHHIFEHLVWTSFKNQCRKFPSVSFWNISFRSWRAVFKNYRSIDDKCHTAMFYRVTLCVSAVFAVARCPSVRPSVTLVHSIQRDEDIVTFLCRPGSPFSGVQNTRMGKFLRFSTEIAVCLGNCGR